MVKTDDIYLQPRLRVISINLKLKFTEKKYFMERRQKRESEIERCDYTTFNVKRFKKKGKWDIVNAMDCVLQLCRGSELCDEFWAIAKSPLKFLTKTLNLSEIQIIVIAILIESGGAESWRSLGNYLGITRLTMMTYSEEVEELVKKGWLIRSGSYEHGQNFQGFRLTFGVVTALRKNRVFVPEKLDDLSLQEFMDRLEIFVNKNLHSNNYMNSEVMEWVDLLIEKNSDHKICQILKRIQDMNERLIMVMILVDYSQYADSEGEGLWFETIDNILDDDFETFQIRDQLKDGNLCFFKERYVEFECNDGVVNNERYLLTKETKNEILNEYKPRRSKVGKLREVDDNKLLKYEDIKEKEMFYNPEEENQITLLSSLLEEEKFKGVQKRLDEEGLRKGFACIFYGAPGTGKTETVLQLARKAGRNIMQINIAGLKDKWVGESEKNIKAVFERYRQICENTKVKPILFFNEADAIFGNRMENIRTSVDKMENAMQNIILQEMENLDGILIATTNLTGALDKAFERRFIFKIEFNKPSLDVKEKLWRSMFRGKLTDSQVRKLAKDYNFSGGEIENIARKNTIDYILKGTDLDFEKICRYCEQERLGNSVHKKVGFRN